MSGARLVFGVNSDGERQLELELLDADGRVIWCETAKRLGVRATSCPVGTVVQISSCRTLVTMSALFTSTGDDGGDDHVGRME